MCDLLGSCIAPSHAVVKFMDVYQRSYCRPIETLVDIFQEYPDEIEYIFKPSCVPLMRCGGCCNDEGRVCAVWGDGVGCLVTPNFAKAVTAAPEHPALCP